MRAASMRPSSAAALVLFSALAVLGSAGAAPAATLFVTNLSDSGPGSLRQQIANAAPGDTIEFTVSGTIVLTSGELLIDKDLTIAGPGPAQLAVSGNNASRVFHVTAGSIVIAGLTLRNGRSGEAGAVRNEAQLTLRGCVVRDSQATLSGGGGIVNFKTMTIVDCTIRNNSALNGTGAGIVNDRPGTLDVIRSTINSNRATTGSGGIFNAGTLTLTNSTVSGNTAGNNSGGINADGVTTIVNSTIAGNSATTAGGVWLSGAVTLRNTIIANNPSGGDCFGSGGTSLGRNLDSDGSCGLGAPGDLPMTNPMLSPLGSYGGPTQTHALLPGSPAIDQIPPADCPVATDQRGVIRPQGSHCDIGAYETVGTCVLQLDGSYQRGTLELDFLLGTGVATTWSTWVFVQNQGVQLWSVPIPPVDPPLSLPLSFSLPPLGKLGFLTFLSTADGIECWDFELIDTGP